MNENQKHIQNINACSEIGTGDPLGAAISMYQLAREVIRANPGIGRERLAMKIGCVPNSAGRFIARFEGEVHGHSSEAAYQKLLLINSQKRGWSNRQVLHALVTIANIDIDKAKRLVARYKGAMSPAPELPPNTDWRKHLKPEPQKLKRTELYARAKHVLAENPGIGMEKLGRRIGCRTRVARKLREQWRGETGGHSSDGNYQRLLRLINERISNRKTKGKNAVGAGTASQKLGISKTMAAALLARYRGATQTIGHHATAPQPAPLEKESALAFWDTTDTELRVLGTRGSEVASPEQLLQREKIDLNVWQVIKTTTQRRESPPGYTEIQITLRPKTAKEHLNSLHKTLLAEFEKAGATKPLVPYITTGSDMLYVPSLPDVHLGKYAWAAETSAPYDIKIATQKVIEAVEDLLTKAALYHPSKVMLPVGNDFFNVDSIERATTNGTPQDEIGRWQETFAAGKAVIVATIDRCRQLAPVHVVVVPGNHDTQRSWYLGDTIASYYRHTSGVTVDNAPTSRKYWQWGQVLIGMVHGDENRHERLPIIMAQECAKAWAECWYREWLLGHFHSRKRKFVAADEDQSGVLIRLMPSLAAADFWHSKKGFWSRRGAEGYLYHRTQGLVVEFTHSIREADNE